MEIPVKIRRQTTLAILTLAVTAPAFAMRYYDLGSFPTELWGHSISVGLKRTGQYTGMSLGRSTPPTLGKYSTRELLDLRIRELRDLHTVCQRHIDAPEHAQMTCYLKALRLEHARLDTPPKTSPLNPTSIRDSLKQIARRRLEARKQKESALPE